MARDQCWSACSHTAIWSSGDARCSAAYAASSSASAALQLSSSTSRLPLARCSSYGVGGGVPCAPAGAAARSVATRGARIALRREPERGAVRFTIQGGLSLSPAATPVPVPVGAAVSTGLVGGALSVRPGGSDGGGLPWTTFGALPGSGTAVSGAGTTTGGAVAGSGGAW